MTLQWVSVDPLTGDVLADLPTLVGEYPLRRTLCQYETGTAHLYLDDAPPNWERAVLEGGAVLGCYDDADDTRAIQWAGLVLEQTRDTSDDRVDLALATAEAYLDRRYVGNVTYTGTGQNAIVADLVSRYVATSSPDPGVPMTVRYVTAGDGAARDRQYKANDNATVYSRIQQLSGVLGGPEFTVEWEWSTDRRKLLPVLLVGDRIGAPAPAGLLPAASFDMPGSVTKAQQVRSFATGKGANKVTAYSSGQGDATPTSDPQRAVDYGGRPTFEHRYQPGSSISSTATLNDYARQAVAILAPGARALTLEAALEAAPRLGDVWRLGDDVGYQIGGYNPATGLDDLVRAFPGGLGGVGRVIAYEVGESTLTPILAQTDVYTEGA